MGSKQQQMAHSSSKPRVEEMAKFPKQQLFVLALCRICEPIAFMSIFPYIYVMIQSFNVSTDVRQIAIYAGGATSAFALAECLTGVIWGRLSDQVGRKPVLIGGLVGTALSMIMFGFAPNLPMALLARAVGGLLNGNIGVLQTTVAELVTVKEHQPRAYSLMPFVWCLGSIIGPALGGALAQPCDSFPSVFARGTIFDRHPFLLPNLVCVAILVCGIITGILFLDETHAEKKYQRDVGRDMGRHLVAMFHREPCRRSSSKGGDANLEETVALLDDDVPPGYSTRDGSPRILASKGAQTRERPSKPGAQKAFTKRVVLNIIGYGILAFHAISFDQLMPIFLSTPVSLEPPHLPFRFSGGFNLRPEAIGLMLAVQGIYSMFAQLFLFPYVVKRFGNLCTFRFVVCVWPLLYLIVPFTVLLPARLQLPGIFVCLLWRITAQVLAFPANAILLTNSAPSLLVLGLINGVAGSTASMSRALGPTLAGVVHSWGVKLGFAGCSWWALGAVAALGAVESLWMQEGGGRLEAAEEMDEEAVLDERLIDPLAIDVAVAQLIEADAEAI